jgi:hypothetical protein
VGGPKTKRHGAPPALTTALTGLSRKSVRLLEREGLLDALDAGRDVAVSGQVVQLGDGGPYARLAFCLDPAGRLCVGYAVSEGIDGPWRREGGEFEPFNQRTHGYWVRYLKRQPLAR